VFNAIFGKEGLVASVDVVVKLLKTKCIPKLLYGLDACPVSSRQFRSLNHVVVSCARKICNVNTSEIAVVCIKMSMTLLMLWPYLVTSAHSNKSIFLFFLC